MIFLRRGVALATALSLVALILTIGLALGTLSTMSLNLSRRDYLNTKATLLARSAVNEFIAEVRILEGQRQIQLFQPQTTNLAQAFPNNELISGCWLGFDTQQPGYSTDNSGSAQWAQGWLDRGTTQTSVPPYTMELLLHATVGGSQRDYRALLRRVWPYAIYSAGGGLVLTGDPDHPGQGSHIQGDVYAHIISPQAINQQHNLETPEAATPAWELFSMFTNSFKPNLNTDIPAMLGPNGTQNPDVVVPSPSPGLSLADNQPYTVTLTGGQAANAPWTSQGGNSLQGSVYYSDYLQRQNLQPSVGPLDQWTGSVSYRELGPNPLNGFNPTQLSADADVSPPGGWPGPSSHSNYLLWGDWQLNGDGAAHSFYVNNSVVNSDIRPGNSVTVDEYGCSLELNDCVLEVAGDLELSDLGHPGYKGIKGNNATLIVDGTLALSGGTLDAGDQGMVILAKDVALSGSGDYYGLLIALNSVSIIPTHGQRLTIHGGILTGGTTASVDAQPGIILRNVDLVQDPRYTKCLNPYGDFQLTAWEPM